MGKEKAFLTYDDINQELPEGLVSPDDIEDIFATLSGEGITISDSEEKLLETAAAVATAEKKFEEPQEEELELDLSPGALDKTNDPVRLYLREMGVVPLLTREGEVAIAKRIERGKIRMQKAISRSPVAIAELLRIGDELANGDLSIREVVTFTEQEGITEEKIEEYHNYTLETIAEIGKTLKKTNTLYEKVLAEPKRFAEAPQDAAQTRAAARRAFAARPVARFHAEDPGPAGLLDEAGQGRRTFDRKGDRQALPLARAQAQRRRDQGDREETARRQAPPHSTRRATQPDLGRDQTRRADRDDGRRRSAAGQEGAGRSQPATGSLDREEIHQPRLAVPRPDPGRQHRPDEGRRQVRVPARLQVLDLRDVVDSPGDHASHRRSGPHHPHPGAHDRNDQQADPHFARARAGTGSRADLGRDR